MPTTNRALWQIKVLHNRNPGHDKLYVVRIDNIGGPKPYRVVAAWGKATNPRCQSEQGKGEFATLPSAQSLMDKLLQQKEDGGYGDVEASLYMGGHSVRSIIEKGYVDTSRIEGYATPSAPASQPAAVAAAAKPKKSKPVAPGAGRAGRDID